MFEVEKQVWKLPEVTWPTHDGAGPVPRSKTQSVTIHPTVSCAPAFYLEKHGKANQLALATDSGIPRIGGHIFLSEVHIQFCLTDKASISEQEMGRKNCLQWVSKTQR